MSDPMGDALHVLLDGLAQNAVLVIALGAVMAILGAWAVWHSVIEPALEHLADKQVEKRTNHMVAAMGQVLESMPTFTVRAQALDGHEYTLGAIHADDRIAAEEILVRRMSPGHTVEAVQAEDRRRVQLNTSHVVTAWIDHEIPAEATQARRQEFSGAAVGEEES